MTGVDQLTPEELTAASTPNNNGQRSRARLGTSDREKEIKIARSLKDLDLKLGKRYRNCRVDNFQLYGTGQEQAEQSAAVDSLKQYGENLTTHVEEGEGLVLFGKQGTGKDHLMAGMLFHAARIGFTVRLVNGMDMYRGVSETWGTDAKESDRLKELTGPDILAISDPLPPTGKLQDYQTNFLYSVIDQRYRKMKPTWVTANFFSGKDAAERLSSQVADRMKDGALTLYCNWPSYRKSLVKQP